MIGIVSRFTPYRLVLDRREPVELKVELKNKYQEAKNASLELKLSHRLSLDRVGYKTSDLKRIAGFKPGETKTFYFQVWPKNISGKTIEPIRIRAIVHPKNDYNEIDEDFLEPLELSIE